MARLGFLGLGIMGGPMAQNLRKAGHELAVWSHNKDKANQFAEANGAAFCSEPLAVASTSECVFLCVGDTEMSREVILGEKGLKAGAAPGLIIVDCSTVAPSASVEMARVLEAGRIEFLDAPCTGSKAGAEGAMLTFMIGGHRSTFDKGSAVLRSNG